MNEHYDPFRCGNFPVGVRTVQLADSARGNRVFPCEIWYPETSPEKTWPLIVFSHSSGGNRRQSTFLTTHLASHGYVVAALDHSEIVSPELARNPSDDSAQSAARFQEWIANRVPDIRFLLDRLLSDETEASARNDRARIGIIGHSFGGWTALATPEQEPRIRAVVALAPGGSSKPVPGVIPATLTFAWGREVPTLYLVAELDVPTPLSGMVDLFDRTPSTKQMVILRRADHAHFMDDMEKIHETFRLSTVPEEYAWMTRAMRPFAELCPTEPAQAFTRSLALAHMDLHLKERGDAQEFLTGDLEATLAAHGIDAAVHGQAHTGSR
jgi:predicted dienelactone hydrolase